MSLIILAQGQGMNAPRGRRPRVAGAPNSAARGNHKSQAWSSAQQFLEGKSWWVSSRKSIVAPNDRTLKDHCFSTVWLFYCFLGLLFLHRVQNHEIDRLSMVCSWRSKNMLLPGRSLCQSSLRVWCANGASWGIILSAESGAQQGIIEQWENSQILQEPKK